MMVDSPWREVLPASTADLVDQGARSLVEGLDSSPGGSPDLPANHDRGWLWGGASLPPTPPGVVTLFFAGQ